MGKSRFHVEELDAELTGVITRALAIGWTTWKK